jgi:hypothetical protein
MTCDNSAPPCENFTKGQDTILKLNGLPTSLSGFEFREFGKFRVQQTSTGIHGCNLRKFMKSLVIYLKEFMKDSKIVGIAIHPSWPICSWNS